MHWGRAHRGRVWHVLIGQLPAQVAECGQESIAETTEHMPPTGGRVCHDCARAIVAKANAVQAALRQAVASPYERAVLAEADSQQLTDFLPDGTRLTPAPGIDLLPVEAQPEAPTLAEEKDDDQRVP